MRKRNNGHLKIKRKDYRIDLRHLANSRFTEQASYLPRGLIYMEDALGKRDFFIEALVPALMSPQYVPRSKTVSKVPDTSLIEGTVRIFWKKRVEPRLRNAIITKCLECQ
jgi:hypothetical protein